MAKQSSISKMQGLEMSPEELKRFLMAALPAKKPILAVGKPGIGKTDIITQATMELEFDLKVIHPVVADPTDVKGMTFVKEGEAKWYPFGDLKDLIEAKRPMVCFLDDLGQASPMVQASYMQLLLFRSINEHKVSEHVTFIAATNRKQDKAGVSGILEPVKSRFASIIHLEVNYKDWLHWGATHNITPELLGYVHWKPSCMDDTVPDPEIVNQPCPRTLANLDGLLKLGLAKDLEHKAYAGAVGPGMTTEFMAYMKVFRDLPDPDEAIANPTTINVPDSTKADAVCALAAAVAVRATKKNFQNVLTLVDRLGPEYAVMTVSTATYRAPELKNMKEFTQWVSKNARYIDG